jgi:hypothetical protein
VSDEDVSLGEIRSQMEAAARVLWGEERAKALSSLIALTAASLARMDAEPLAPSDELDSLDN